MAVVDRVERAVDNAVSERGQYRDQSQKKRPHARQDQPQVVSGPAHHRVQRGAEFALEQVSREQPVGLHVPDHGLHDLAPLEQPIQRRLQPSGVAQDQPRGRIRRRDTAVAAIELNFKYANGRWRCIADLYFNVALVERR